jgi:fatty-acyl-CoA synthase
VQFTSGTTGAPKGATLSHRSILNNGYFTGRILRYTEDDRVCVPVPFYHCFGMVLANLACLTHGACVVVPGASFDALATLRIVEEERCTSMYGVPTMFIAQLEHPRIGDFDLSSLRTGIMAGAPCPVEVMTKVRAQMHMDEVTIGCGMTETAPLSTQTAVDDDVAKRVTTVGRVHPHVEVKIVDPETGETVPRGTPGEQCTRGYSVMLGYYDDERTTREAVDDDGWMHSGDLATMDDDGYVRIVGRIKDMLIRGGENIYPARSRSSCSPSRTSATPTSSACPARATARRSWPGSGCATAARWAPTSCAPPAAGGSRATRSRATGSSSTSSP